MSDKKKAFWFIALLSTLVIIPFLGETIFYSKGEPREAIVAYSMLESGNWILPLNYGTDIAYKPPFLYWSIAAISAIFGGVSEFSSRLPSAIAFLAMQFVFFGFVARYKDTKTAVITSLLLLTSFEVHRAAVACRLDMLQVSFIVISLCLLFRWDEKGCKGIPWTAVVLMACGTLTKGPVGSIFPCMCIGIYQLIRGRSFGKTFLSLFGIGLLSLIPLGIWFYAAWLQGGQPFMDLMLEENTGRFVGKMSYPSHHNPLWYNFLTIIWGWTPWTLVLLISLFGLKWNEMHLLPAGNSFTGRIRKVWDNIRSQSPIQLFIWIVIIAIFVFYCIPKSKTQRLFVAYLSIYGCTDCPVSGGVNAKRGESVQNIGLYLRLALFVTHRGVFCCTLSDDTGQHMGQRTSCCRKHSVYASFGKHVLFYFQMADYSIAGSGCHLYIKAGYQKK